MDHGVDPKLLWSLLLAQIVYDESGKPAPVDFSRVAQIYRRHPMLPRGTPPLLNATEAQKVFSELVAEYEVPEGDLRAQSAAVAEPVYAKFHKNLLDKMQEDADDFSKAYAQLEQKENFPLDERLQK